MKATYHETWGVYLGWSRPFMGGFLYMVQGKLTWGWGYYPNPIYNDGNPRRFILGCTENGDAVLVDDHGAYVSNDRASQLLLEPFLFPGEILAPYVRFPISTTGS